MFVEKGSYWVNGNPGTSTDFFAVQTTGTNGELLIAGLNVVIDSISFISPGKILGLNQDLTTSGWQDHEFSLQSLQISQVPVPAAFWLFGTSLIGFVSFARRVKV